jgi:hypothetical protein
MYFLQGRREGWTPGAVDAPLRVLDMLRVKKRGTSEDNILLHRSTYIQYSTPYMQDGMSVLNSGHTVLQVCTDYESCYLEESQPNGE